MIGIGVNDMLQGINLQQPDRYAAYDNVQFNRARQESVVQTANEGKQDDKQVSKVEAPKELDLRLDAIRPREELDLENLKLSLNESSDAFEMKGRDSDILSLDMEKAISDMQKDQALMQYQYFVGDSNPFVSTEDGVVIAK